VIQAESDPKAKATLGGFVGTHTSATALGVFVGTTAIRAELAEINENQEDAPGGDTEGGFMDSLGDFF